MVRPNGLLQGSLSPYLKAEEPEHPDSYIDDHESCYYSRLFESKLQSQNHPIQECVFFRHYLGVDRLENAYLTLRIELYFKPTGEHVRPTRTRNTSRPAATRGPSTK
jgi:hypothetical protein